MTTHARLWTRALCAVAITGCADGGPVHPIDDCEDDGCGGVDSAAASSEDDDGSASADGSDVDDGGDPGDDDSGDPQSGGIPCDVLDVLRANCHLCHDDPPTFGAPMPLVDYDDLQVPAPSDPTRKVHELVAERLVDDAAPMPPTTAMEATDRDRLLEWIAAGALEDPTAQCTPDDDGDDTDDELPCEPDFVVTAHASGSEEGFAVPAVGADNLYMCFAFKAPFDVDTHATAWAPVIDDERVVHHWILYRTQAPQAEGAVSLCDVTLQLSTQFVAGWAPGGGNVVMPPDVGLELGGPDDWYILQVHYNNTAHHDDAVDKSGVAFCTSEQPRPKTAGILTLGTLNIAIPPGAQDYQTTGICSGLTTAWWPQMHLLGGSPHMHELGRAMRTTVTRLDGTTEMILDAPNFDFESQGMHTFDPEVVIQPGETLSTTCTYDNPNLWPVLFGEGTNDEMCFDFVLAYPIDALLNRNCGIGP